MAAFIFSGCSNVFSPTASQAAGKGNVTVSFANGDGGRSIMPSLLDFDLYVFTFTKNGEEIPPFEVLKKDIKGSVTFSLERGEGYTLNVKAYKGETLAAEGNSYDPEIFTVGDSTLVKVQLEGNLSGGPDGTFSFNIQYPSGAKVESLILKTRGKPSIVVLDGTEAGSTETGISGSLAVPAGYWGLEVDLVRGDSVALYDDIVVIYSDTVTFFGTEAAPYIFKAGDFISTDPNAAIQVNEWHGIHVLTDPADGKFPESSWYSYGVGTQYSSIELPDNDGITTTYSDVLKVVPPSGGYPAGSVPLIYMTPDNATYTFSMKVRLEFPAGQGGAFNWQHQISGYPSLYSTSVSDKWVDITFSISNTGIQESSVWDYTVGKCVYVQNNTYLNYGTFYIRDLVVTKNGVCENESGINDPIEQIDELWVSHERVTLAPGGILWVTAFPNEGVSFSSDNNSIATVESYFEGQLAYNVLINAKAVGSTTIRLRHLSGKTAEVAVKVELPRDMDKPKKYVCLTFDDGPFPGTTEHILDVLREYGAAATFYVVGGNVRGRPDIVKRMKNEGHGIGNHTNTHFSGGSATWNNADMIEWEYTEGQNAMNDVIGPNYASDGQYRQPTGTYNPMIVDTARRAGKALSGAGEVCFDWRGAESSEDLAAHIRRIARPWGIINMHDARWETANAVDIFVPAMIADGWVFVTYDEMLAAKRASHFEPGFIYEYFGDDLREDPSFDESVLNVKGVLLSSGNEFKLGIGESKTVKATVLPRVAENRNVTWSTSNPAIATVDSNGVVTAVGYGTANIIATSVSGGKTGTTRVDIIGANEAGTYTTWNIFDWPGWDGYLSSYAEGEVLENYRPGDGYSYSNVLRLSPPEGGYKNTPIWGCGAMTFVVEDPGLYTISVDVWVETDESAIDFRWTDDHSWAYFNFDSLTPGGWYTVTATSTSNLGAGTIIELIARESGDTGIGLQDATVYLKNMKLERAGADRPAVDITGTKTAVETASPGIALEWENGAVPLTVNVSGGGSIVGQESVTVTKDSVVTITAPLGFTNYQWLIGRKEVSNTDTYEFTATGDDYTILLWVDGRSKGASIRISVNQEG